MREPPAVTRPVDDRIGLGISGMVAAIALFAIADATVKWLAGSYSPFEIVFFRHLFGMIPIAVLVWRGGGVGALATRRPIAHALRAAFLFFALAALYVGLAHMPLAEAIAVAFTAPLFTTALSRPVLGEPVGPRRWAAVTVGFAGALVMIRPGTEAFRPEALLVLAAALCFASAALMTRHMARSETNVAILTYSTIGALLGSLPFLGAVWLTPSAGHLGLFALIGLLGGVGAYLVIVAYRHAPAAVVAPFEYTALVWAAIIGWLVWREQPDPAVWLGAGLIAVAGIYITHREAAAARSGPG